MLRAHVRALREESSQVAARDFTAVASWGGLHALPAVSAVSDEHSAWWHDRFAVDGLGAERIQVVRRAAEGVDLAALYGEEDEASIGTARRLLLALATDGTFRTPI